MFLKIEQMNYTQKVDYSFSHTQEKCSLTIKSLPAVIILSSVYAGGTK